MMDSPKKRLSRPTLLIGLCFVLGGGGLFGCASSSVARFEAPNHEAQDDAKVASIETARYAEQALEPHQDADVASGVESVAITVPSGEEECCTVDLSIAPDTFAFDERGATLDSPTLQFDPIETADLATLTLNLADAQGKPYTEVRDRILASGWIPHTFSTTTGPESEFLDSRVEEMEGLGFMEVKACSGTGVGLCRFEFVYEERTADNGPILAVTTTAAAPGDLHYPMPNFWSVSQENISDLTYSDRPFDLSLFTQLQDEEAFCLGVGRCVQAQYRFKDALLLSASGGFGTVKISLIPDGPVSKEEAIAYARILDAETVIDFDQSDVDRTLNTETYYEPGLPAEPVDELGSITTVRLQFTPDGNVSEISFSVIVL